MSNSQSSAVIVFELAFAQVLIDKGIIEQHELRDRYLEIRKAIPYGASFDDSDDKIRDILGIPEGERL